MDTNPIISLSLQVISNPIFKHISNWCHHLSFYVTHPKLDITVLRINFSDKLYIFTFTRNHRSHTIIHLECKVRNSFKNFSQMCSNLSHFFGLRKYFKQFIVWKEIKSGKIGTLLLQIISKPFLHNFEVLIWLLKRIFISDCWAILKNAWIFLTLANYELPLIINTFETLSFGWQLLHNVRRVKNWL